VEVASARVSRGEQSTVKTIINWAEKENLADKIEILGFVDKTRTVEWMKESGAGVLNLLTKGSKKHLTLQLNKTEKEHLNDIEETVNFAVKNRKLTTVDPEGTKWNSGFTPYTFKDDSAAATPDATTIHLEMWEGYKDYMIDWVYNKASNDYSRKNAGVAHMDKNTNKQLRAKTIVVMYMQESHANDGYENNAHLLYGNKGKGKAVVFMDGREIKANWSKNGRTGKTIITDAGTGKEIAFNRGKLWFEVLPLDGVLTAK
jgi:hypothetical protein